MNFCRTHRTAPVVEATSWLRDGHNARRCAAARAEWGTGKGRESRSSDPQRRQKWCCPLCSPRTRMRRLDQTASPNGCCPVGTAGGRCYGYRNVPAEGGGVKLVIHPEEAAIGERIFELSANGLSLKSVAAELNREKVPPPRPRTTSKPASWCPTAIREMLRRELYVGRVIWNRSRFTKVPGTNRRVARPRPSSEWRLSERPETENHQRRTLAAGLG